jgi:4-amino-4-deoxy-L-arabinose transferase-like glycosyltransferase
VRRVPAAAWVCALVACLNATSWSFITPPFEVPDEPSHIAYVKQLAETGTLPRSSEEAFAAEEGVAMVALDVPEIRLNPSHRAIVTQAQQNAIVHELRVLRRAHERGSLDAGVATSEPPLYYALQSIPYTIGLHATLLTRIQLMRLLSALFTGLTALFTFLFLREALPRVRWAWTVGALGVALVPLLGFMSGAVNPDAMLFAVSAAIFYCIARAFRRGLTIKAGAVFGATVAIGFLTKLSFVGLAPGIYFALALIAVRGRRARGRRGTMGAVLGASIGCLPIVLFVVENAVSHHHALGIVTRTVATSRGSLLAGVSYIWQLYLPRLPGMFDYFPGLSTSFQVWFVGYVGRLGWLDTFFPGWVYTLALIPAAVIAGLCGRTLIAARASLRARTGELCVYASMALGELMLIGVASYRIYPTLVAEYGQARYLLPMLPLLGAVLALAARGAGRRWGPTAGALIVTLFLAHDLLSQLQVIARYYG